MKIIAGIVLTVLLIAGCGSTHAASAPRPVPTVTVTKTVTKTIVMHRTRTRTVTGIPCAELGSGTLDIFPTGAISPATQVTCTVAPVAPASSGEWLATAPDGMTVTFTYSVSAAASSAPSGIVLDCATVQCVIPGAPGAGPNGTTCEVDTAMGATVADPTYEICS